MRIILSAAALFLAAQTAAAGTVTVYHTGDVHGWYTARPAKWLKESPERMIGGFPALAALVKAEKNPWLLLDSGDMFQGTPEGNFSRGLASMELMSRLGYSAAAVGNHDYDYGEEALRAMVSSATFPLLAANVYVKETGKPVDYLKPYTMVERGGYRIAILGLAGRHTPTSTLPSNVKHLAFADEAAETKKWLKEIAAKRPAVVLILAHTGLSGRNGKLSEIPEPDLSSPFAALGTLAISSAAAGTPAVVFGGHVHAGLMNGYYDKSSGVMIAESYWGLTDVTKADLHFDDATGKFTGATVNLLPLWTDTTGEDAETAAVIARYKALADVEMEKPLGEAAVDLGPSENGLDSPIGNWFTDAMRRQSGTQVAFQNTPGIRSDMRKGKLKVRDVYQVMPFENTLVKMSLTGEQIKRLLEENLSGGRAKLQLSGLTVRFSRGADGKASVTLERDGKEIKPEEKLTVATNNYLTTGGTGGGVFAEAEDQVDTMVPLRDLLMKDLRENPVKELPAGGRITRLP